MSNAIRNFGTLYNNPFIFGPVFCKFYQSLGQKPKSILLSYLVLPLTLHPQSRKFLVNANRSSSVRTLVAERERIYGIESRIRHYQDFTTVSLQYAVDRGWIRMEGDSILIDKESDPSDSICPQDVQRAASRLGMLFAPFDVPTAFRMLGIRKL